MLPLASLFDNPATIKIGNILFPVRADQNFHLVNVVLLVL